MSNIFHIQARQILDSRGNPTIEVDVITQNRFLGRSSVPSGASIGEHEAFELRDNRKEYMGKGVLQAVENVNKIIAQKLIGISVFEQNTIDKLMIELDGTYNKSKLGANAILGVSLATARAAANVLNLPLFRYIGGINVNTLPIPMINVINGGVHSDAPIAFQEFMIIPIKARSFIHAMQMGTEIFHNLKQILREKNLSITVGDEGGFSPNFIGGIEEVFNTLKYAIEKANYRFGTDIKLAIDCAASEFYKDGIYDYSKFEGKIAKKRCSTEQAEYLAELCQKYPIISIEDGMDENDWKGWKYLTELIGDKVQLVGDDLFVTNVKRLLQGIKKNIANSILIKVNQIGTLTETIEAVKMAHKAGYTSIMSHRSGETEDNIIADLSVALNCEQIKTGSVSRSDRMSKYNQLLRIEEILGKYSYYPQDEVFKNKINFY